MLLKTTIATLISEFDLIPAERKARLKDFAACIVRQRTDLTSVAITYICTHNSRRSHMAQLWAQAAAAHFQIENIRTYSGGTEATAFYSGAVAALCEVGFFIDTNDQSTNPVYRVSDDQGILIGKANSKVFDAPPNPTTGYIAVMTCSSAASHCPVTVGCADRVVLTYDDPKQYDGTIGEAEAYTERCRQIGREMLYVFGQIAG